MHLLFVLLDFTIVFALLGIAMLHHFATTPFALLYKVIKPLWAGRRSYSK